MSRRQTGAMVCPCCGSAMPAHVVPREELVGRLEVDSPVYLAIVRRLAWRPGNLVSNDELVDFVWRYDPDGGPLDSSRAIYNAIYGNRETLWDLGWWIENHRSRWRLEIAGARHG